MNGMIRYTDKFLMKTLLEDLLRQNPLLKLGDPLTGPCASVENGKVIEAVDVKPPKNLINLQSTPPELTPAPRNIKYVSAVSRRIMLNDIGNPEARFDLCLTKPTYIHPYVFEVGSREWLEKYNPGDLVAVATIDSNTFETTFTEVPLTQQMIDDNSHASFRFALSD